MAVGACFLAFGATAQEPLDHFFDSDGVRIRYIEAGLGPPVVLIHGYLADADRHWVSTGVFADLEKDHRVIALDCRGHGKSDKPSQPTEYGAEMANDVVRLLDHLEIQRAHVVGFSMGAFIVGRLVTAHSERLISATFAGHHPIRAWTAADESDAESWARDLESPTPFRSLILAISPQDAVPSESEIRRRSREFTSLYDTKALAAYHRGLHTLAVTDGGLTSARTPMLAVIGTQDPSLAGVQALKAIIPDVSLVVVSGAEHGGERGVLRRTEFLTALQQFLRGNEVHMLDNATVSPAPR
jgi:pimeloyl-ACP methyl ester carboxylesterase